MNFVGSKVQTVPSRLENNSVVIISVVSNLFSSLPTFDMTGTPSHYKCFELNQIEIKQTFGGTEFEDGLK